MISQSKEYENDTKDAFDSIKTTLLKSNYDLLFYKNVNKNALKSITNDIAKLQKNYNSILFFYKGFAISNSGKNFICAVPDSSETSHNFYDLEVLLDEIPDEKNKIIILDTNKPSGEYKSIGFLKPRPNSLILMSNLYDNSYKSGLFSSEFAIFFDGNNLLSIIPKLRSEIYKRSNGEILPVEINTLFHHDF